MPHLTRTIQTKDAAIVREVMFDKGSYSVYSPGESHVRNMLQERTCYGDHIAGFKTVPVLPALDRSRLHTCSHGVASDTGSG